MSNITLRDFEIKDKKDFYDMAALFYESGVADKIICREILHNTFNQCVNKSPFIRGVFICHDYLICGYALLTFTYSNEYGGLIMFIDELYVKEDFRTKGIASFFLSSIISEYKNDVVYVEVVISKNNRADVNICQKIGFVVNNYISMHKVLYARN